MGSRPALSSFEQQPQINATVRSKLISWLVDVHARLNLLPETLFLAISILDRTSCRVIIHRNRYQLTGLTCLWIASKYEDLYANIPSLQSLMAVCEQTYTIQDFKSVELCILNQLKFSVGFPTCRNYLQLLFDYGLDGFDQYNEYAPLLRSFCRYSLELTLPHLSFLQYSQYEIALVSIHIARWLSTGYEALSNNPVLQGIAHKLIEILKFPLTCVYAKYETVEHLFVSKWTQDLLR